MRCLFMDKTALHVTYLGTTESYRRELQFGIHFVHLWKNKFIHLLFLSAPFHKINSGASEQSESIP